MTTDSPELSSELRNAMMVFVAKFLFVILPPLIGFFFYILTITKDDVKTSVKNEITKVEQIHQSNVTLRDKIEQIHQSNVVHMKSLHDKIEQTHQSNVAEIKALKDRVEQTRKDNVVEMGKLKDGIKACEENCKKNLELKISENRTVSERFKMDFKVDKKKVEFKFEEIK